MPIYEVECKKCGNKDEVLTLRFSESLPKCECGGEFKKLMPSRITWRWALEMGCWEEVNGRQKYVGPGGKKVTLGGEKLDVHDGMPVESRRTPDTQKADSDDAETLDEIDPKELPEGVDH